MRTIEATQDNNVRKRNITRPEYAYKWSFTVTKTACYVIHEHTILACSSTMQAEVYIYNSIVLCVQQ